MKQKIFIAIIIFIVVLSVVVFGKQSTNADYYNSLHYLEDLLQSSSAPVTNEGLLMNISDFLRVTDFVNFVNALPQKLDFMGIMYILSIVFLTLRLYVQKLFNKYNLAIKFPVVSTFCLIVYMIISFTFTSKINLFEILLIYAILLLSIQLIVLIWQNEKSNTIKKENYNDLDANNKPLYFTAMKRKKIHIWDMAMAGFIFLTIKGIYTLPIIYVIFATIPYCIYSFYQLKSKYSLYNQNIKPNVNK